jgi:hypothetical protein
MKTFRFLLMVCVAVLFASCNDNPAWDGHKAASKAEAHAVQTCKCVYEMMEKEPGYDLPKIMEEVKALKKIVPNDLQNAVLTAETPAIMKANQNEAAFSEKMDDCECMKPVNDLLLEQGVDFHDVMEQLDLHCLLGAFYN